MREAMPESSAGVVHGVRMTEMLIQVFAWEEPPALGLGGDLAGDGESPSAWQKNRVGDIKPPWLRRKLSWRSFVRMHLMPQQDGDIMGPDLCRL
jgi:hypothetical protein